MDSNIDESDKSDSTQQDFERVERAAQMIMLARIYDVLIAILSRSDATKAAELLKMHEAGELWCPTPAIRIGEWHENTDTV